jgi:hypothetical protein
MRFLDICHFVMLFWVTDIKVLVAWNGVDYPSNPGEISLKYKPIFPTLQVWGSML